MLDIKNFDLIANKVCDFRFGDLKYILDIKFSIEIDTVSIFDVHNQSTLDITFILIPKDNVKKYKVTIRFEKIGSLQLHAGGTVIQLSVFEIMDIKDRGWDSIKYLVRDFENEDEFKFYCLEIEVIAIEEIDLVVT